MRREVEEVGGDVTALGDPKWAKNILNVRFRVENVDLLPPAIFADDNETWLNKRHRYLFYSIPDDETSGAENRTIRRKGARIPPELSTFFRRGASATSYTPEHRKMQSKLFKDLQARFGEHRVVLEQDFVDITVYTETEIILYEIKTDIEARTAIRNALGQILEYAFHPQRKHSLPVRLIIVGQSRLSQDDERYIRILQERCALRLDYTVVTI